MTNPFLNNLKTLLFDLDGTLLDSFSIHFEVYKTMFARFGIQLNKKKFLSTYSPNWYNTYDAMGLPKENWEKANSYWLEEAEKKIPRLLPGVLESLVKLSERYELGLITSGSKSRVVRDLERNKIKHFFKIIVTGDDLILPKPSPEGLELALNKLEKRANEVVYVGDASADYEMAKAAGVHFIGVKSDFKSLSFNHPDYHINSIDDLPELLGVLKLITK